MKFDLDMFHEIVINSIFAFLIVIYDLLLYLYNVLVIQENIELMVVVVVCKCVFERQSNVL